MYHMYCVGEQMKLAQLADLPADLQPLAEVIEREATAQRPRRLRLWVGDRQNPVAQKFPSITGYLGQDDGWHSTSIIRYTANSKKHSQITLSDILAISTTRIGKSFIYMADGFAPLDMQMVNNEKQKMVSVVNPATGEVCLRLPYGAYRT